MKKFRIRVSIFYLLAGVCVCVFLLGSSIKSSVKQEQFHPSVRSLVPNLEIISMEMVGPHVLQVIVRNNYEKDITAVVAFIGEEKVTRSDYLFAELEKEQKLSPGATDRFVYTIDSKEEENIVIKTVLFSDLTIDGDLDAVRGVLDKRRGVKIQLARFNPYLAKLNKAEYSHVQTELQKARQFAENLPIKMDDGSPMSRVLEFGLKHGRELILSYLSEMNNLLVGDERKIGLSNNQDSLSARYERFRNKSLRVENHFKSLQRRL